MIAAAVAAQTALARVSRGALCPGVVALTGGDCLGLFGRGEVGSVVTASTFRRIRPVGTAVGFEDSVGLSRAPTPPTAVRSVPCGRRPAVSQRGGRRFGGDELAWPCMAVWQGAHPAGRQVYLRAFTCPGRILVHGRVMHLRGVGGPPGSGIGDRT